ncbi:DUF3119 domain-containing protein [Chloropicon primus]|uniref:DUF3119 domain-containing protein n=2 Tax=Chloropicon primus TaxID=1764295 RepID=A0A5B8MSL0_9CHLO|nr:hypothetical protein A3770_11p62660 [Chloropicon primus]UPR02961.1 DUF3119 domain-containing protein [Chloropicon primus]|eukprot:QDZ23748.1 hypothetical protein A3770_11p62660 [Chloropicon primus]
MASTTTECRRMTRVVAGGARASTCGASLPAGLRPKRVVARPRGGTTTRLVVRASPDTRETTVIPEPSYNVPLGLVGLSGISAIGLKSVTLSGLFGVLGLFLLFQAQRVKFCFDDEALEVLIGDQLEESGPNAFVGGRNRWKYDTFVNWEFWWPGFPCLVYFKETQTKPEGQIHFFPIIMDGEQLYDVMRERCGSSQNSLPEN